MIKERKWLVDLAGGAAVYPAAHRTWESRCVRVVIFRQKRSEKGKNIRLHYFWGNFPR